MPKSLHSALSRVNRLLEAQREESAGDVQEALVARLFEGRRRAAQAAKSGERRLRLSYEEIRARGSALRAALRAEGIIR
jgi:hypothetical protein